jgi:hypothetical protein
MPLKYLPPLPWSSDTGAPTQTGRRGPRWRPKASMLVAQEYSKRACQFNLWKRAFWCEFVEGAPPPESLLRVLCPPFIHLTAATSTPRRRTRPCSRFGAALAPNQSSRSPSLLTWAHFGRCWNCSIVERCRPRRPPQNNPQPSPFRMTPCLNFPPLFGAPLPISSPNTHWILNCTVFTPFQSSHSAARSSAPLVLPQGLDDSLSYSPSREGKTLGEAAGFG